jgi:hypothetical protein
MPRNACALPWPSTARRISTRSGALPECAPSRKVAELCGERLSAKDVWKQDHSAVHEAHSSAPHVVHCATDASTRPQDNSRLDVGPEGCTLGTRPAQRCSGSLVDDAISPGRSYVSGRRNGVGHIFCARESTDGERPDCLEQHVDHDACVRQPGPPEGLHSGQLPSPLPSTPVPRRRCPRGRRPRLPLSRPCRLPWPCCHSHREVAHIRRPHCSKRRCCVSLSFLGVPSGCWLLLRCRWGCQY